MTLSGPTTRAQPSNNTFSSKIYSTLIVNYSKYLYYIINISNMYVQLGIGMSFYHRRFYRQYQISKYAWVVLSCTVLPCTSSLQHKIMNYYDSLGLTYPVCTAHRSSSVRVEVSVSR